MIYYFKKPGRFLMKLTSFYLEMGPQQAFFSGWKLTKGE